MKIRNKINFNFLFSFILIVSVIGFVVGLYATKLVKKNIYSYLNSSNRARAEHLRTFIGDQKTAAVLLAAASVYRDFLKESATSSQYELIKDKLDKRLLRNIESDPNIKETFILDRLGKIVASSDKAQEGSDKSQDDYFLKAQEEVFIKDIYFSETIKKTTYAIAVPIKDDNGDFLGVSVLRYLPDNFLKIIKIGNDFSNTEENFLINKNKFFITPSRFLNNDVVLKQKVETKNAENCFNAKEIDYVKKYGYLGMDNVFESQIIEAKDYRNIDVIATHAYIPETGWCLITKADKTDLMSFQKDLILYFLFIFSAAALAFSLLSLSASKRITSSIASLLLGIKKVKQGDLGYKTKLQTKDEMGELSEAFDDLTNTVQESKIEIEKKVSEQTAEIKHKALELENQKNAILNILEDVEKEKDKTELLARDLEKFKLAVDNASDHIIITDSEGMVIYGNRAAEKITGYKLKEIIGKKAGLLWRLPMPLEYYQKMWRTIKIKKQIFSGEIKNKRKSGDLYDANISISPVINGENEVIYFVGIEHDITKEKEVDRAKTEFVSLASHQLRTPLSAINWYTEMLLAGDAGKINQEQKKYLVEIAAGNQRMVDLVDSLLNVSRLDLGTFIVEPVLLDVIGLAKSVLEEMRPQILSKHLQVDQEYNQNIQEFSADQKLLRMVFQNLLSNAVKYTPEKGKLKLAISSCLKGELFGGQKIDKDSLAIMISDSGMGIPEGQKDKIFSKMFRADNARESETEGTGLGLYIIKSIVDHSGGKIWFESKEGFGTTFYVTFLLSGMLKKEGLKKLD